MSHDRGCPCGREKYEYRDCTRSDCFKRPSQLTHLLAMARLYRRVDQPVPLDLEARIAAEGGSLNPIHDNSEEIHG